MGVDVTVSIIDSGRFGRCSATARAAAEALRNAIGDVTLISREDVAEHIQYHLNLKEREDMKVGEFLRNLFRDAAKHNLLGGGNRHPADIYTGKSKTFKQNRRKQMARKRR